METINKEKLYSVFQDSILANQFENTVTIPKQYLLTENETITKLNVNKDTFKSIMEKLRFFMVKELPYEIYDYVMEDCQADLEDFKDFHYEELVLLRDEYSEIQGIREVFDGYNNLDIRHGLQVTEVSVNDMKEYLMHSCLKKHYYNLIKHLVKRGFSKKCYVELSELISRTGTIEDYKFLIENDFPIDCSVVRYIACEGKLDCLKYVCEHFLKNNEDPFQTNILQTSIASDNWDVVKYVMSKLNKKKLSKQIDYLTTSRAAQNGNLEMLKYFHNIGAPLHPLCLQWASQCGQYIFDETDVQNIDYKKYFDCVKYLHQHNCPSYFNLVEEACRYTNLKIIKFLIENGYNYNLYNCIEEAKNNETVLQYLKTLR